MRAVTSCGAYVGRNVRRLLGRGPACPDIGDQSSAVPHYAIVSQQPPAAETRCEAFQPDSLSFDEPSSLSKAAELQLAVDAVWLSILCGREPPALLPRSVKRSSSCVRASVDCFIASRASQEHRDTPPATLHHTTNPPSRPLRNRCSRQQLAARCAERHIPLHHPPWPPAQPPPAAELHRPRRSATSSLDSAQHAAFAPRAKIPR